MNTKRKLSTTGPEGLTATRTTHREYSFTVWVRPLLHLWRSRLETNIADQTKYIARYQGYLDSGDLPDTWDDKLGTMVRCTPEKVQGWIETSKGWIARDEAKLAAGYAEPWTCENWTSRRDLAEREAYRMRSKGYETFIGEVQ